jgi:cyclic pyranopterin phosphate synthase
MEQLVDTFGRVHRDLRISVTDRCNFRCTYCMPEEGMNWLPRSELLSFEEIERIAGVLVERFGVDSIRLTGGEPTVRARLPLLVEKLAALGTDLAMTTNGSTLRLLADELKSAGLKRLNVSLDTLQADRFLEMTRRDDLAKVLDGIEAARSAGFAPIKVNAVVMRGVNDDELVDFASWARDLGLVMRFIEFMPLDADKAWTNTSVVGLTEIVERIDAVYPLEPVPRGSAPATTFRYADGGGEIGVIASVTQSFCESCDRIRLSAEGQFRNCLFAVDEYDMRPILRSGGSDDELAEAMRGAVLDKWAGHQINQVHFIRPRKSMSQLGG